MMSALAAEGLRPSYGETEFPSGAEARSLYARNGAAKAAPLQGCWLSVRAQGDRKTAREKLQQALAIFTELKMPRERDEVQAELDRLSAESP